MNVIQFIILLLSFIASSSAESSKNGISVNGINKISVSSEQFLDGVPKVSKSKVSKTKVQNVSKVSKLSDEVESDQHRFHSLEGKEIKPTWNPFPRGILTLLIIEYMFIFVSLFYFIYLSCVQMQWNIFSIQIQWNIFSIQIQWNDIFDSFFHLFLRLIFHWV